MEQIGKLPDVMDVVKDMAQLFNVNDKDDNRNLSKVRFLGLVVAMSATECDQNSATTLCNQYAWDIILSFLMPKHVRIHQNDVYLLT